jgi:predicted DNA-binding transcriptional regulator AlpA
METIDPAVTGRRGMMGGRRRARRRLLSMRETCARYGVVDRTVERWMADAGLKFPKPLRIRCRRYFDEEELDEFDARSLGGE